VLALVGLALLCAGCPASGLQPKGNDLHGVVKRFHHNLRWKYNEDAAARVDPRYSADFRDRLEDLSEDWNVTAWDVRKVELDKEGKVARLRVHLKYYYLNSPVLKEEKVREVWKLVEDQWTLTEWEGGPLKVPTEEAEDPKGGSEPGKEVEKPNDRKPPATGVVRDLPQTEDGE